MQEYETVSGLEECVKNSEHAEGFHQARQTWVPFLLPPTYLDSFPLRASVYLSAKQNNKGYLRGTQRR